MYTLPVWLSFAFETHEIAPFEVIHTKISIVV